MECEGVFRSCSSSCHGLNRRENTCSDFVKRIYRAVLNKNPQHELHLGFILRSVRVGVFPFLYIFMYCICWESVLTVKTPVLLRVHYWFVYELISDDDVSRYPTLEWEIHRHFWRVFGILDLWWECVRSHPRLSRTVQRLSEGESFFIIVARAPNWVSEYANNILI